MICECEYCAYEGENDCPRAKLQTIIEKVETWITDHTSADGDTVSGSAHEIDEILEGYQ